MRTASLRIARMSSAIQTPSLRRTWQLSKRIRGAGDVANAAKTQFEAEKKMMIIKETYYRL